jgi:hypothetical protein
LIQSEFVSTPASMWAGMIEFLDFSISHPLVPSLVDRRQYRVRARFGSALSYFLSMPSKTKVAELLSSPLSMGDGVSTGLTQCSLGNVWVEHSQVAGAGKYVPELLGFAKHPVPVARSTPIALVASGAIDNLNHADQAALKKDCRQGLVQSHFPKELKTSGIEGCAGVDEKGAAEVRSASPVFDVLVPGDDSPRPRLSYAESLRLSH